MEEGIINGLVFTNKRLVFSLASQGKRGFISVIHVGISQTEEPENSEPVCQPKCFSTKKASKTLICLKNGLVSKKEKAIN